MNKETREHVSSLMDGELPPEASLFLARRMSTDQELGQLWERFHLIRECLRRPGEPWVLAELDLDLDEIPREPVQSTQSTGSLSRWLRPVAGVAVAASVAVVAILIAIGLPDARELTEDPVVRQFTSPNTLGTIPVSQPASFTAQSREEQRRLNSYLLRHNQVAGAVGQQGFISLVPIVTTVPVQVLERDDGSGDGPAESESEEGSREER